MTVRRTRHGLASARGLAPGTAYAPNCSPRWATPRRAWELGTDRIEVCIDSSVTDTILVWVIGSGRLGRPLPPRADSLWRELSASLAPRGARERGRE